MAGTRERVPHHLRRFVVEQDYAAYTAVDHAVWRFVLLQMYDRLQHTAHPAYARGLERTGMSVERIPSIAEMDRCLGEFGWGAVCVDGFIPPRAFVEFQALGILPIAAEIRRVEHLPYTPAPDIIHEAGGHAPILPDPEYAAFLRRIGDYGLRAFASERDGRLYDAIYRLSVVKEQRDASAHDVAEAERALAELAAAPAPPSEAAQLARLYWWTAEYGLVGTPQDYKLYGAGLLSSLAESHFCHEPGVRKLPLTADCVEVDYDITRPQPQLFVARDFAELTDVLEAACAGFAFKRGGLPALRIAQAAREVATVELPGGVSVIGEVASTVDDGARAQLAVLRGPCALAVNGRIEAGHGPEAHPGGVAIAFGPLDGGGDPAQLEERELLRRFAAGPERRVSFALAGGLQIDGRLVSTLESGAGRAFVLQEARALRGASPCWGGRPGAVLILASGPAPSVRAGAIDPSYYPEADYLGIRAPARKPEDTRQQAIVRLYERAAARSPEVLAQVHDALRRDHPEEWLLRWNALEALTEADAEPQRRAELVAELWRLEAHFAQRNPIAMGLRYLGYAEPT